MVNFFNFGWEEWEGCEEWEGWEGCEEWEGWEGWDW